MFTCVRYLRVFVSICEAVFPFLLPPRGDSRNSLKARRSFSISRVVLKPRTYPTLPHVFLTLARSLVKHVANERPAAHRRVENEGPAAHRRVENEGPAAHRRVENERPAAHRRVEKELSGTAHDCIATRRKLPSGGNFQMLMDSGSHVCTCAVRSLVPRPLPPRAQ